MASLRSATKDIELVVRNWSRAFLIPRLIRPGCNQALLFLAEVNHFQHYRVGDFAAYMRNFLQQQVAFHKEVITKY